jgi:hypothetical protein
MSKSIEIVTHCWAEEYPLFAGALGYQLASLVLHPPKDANVSVTVCISKTDETTISMIKNPLWDPLSLRALPLDVETLGRRCMGRNVVAKWTREDIVWFCDVDHFFGPDCLRVLSEMDWPEGASMIFPRQIQIHHNHQLGDETLRLMLRNPRLELPSSRDFVDKDYNRAIGGVQIVQGHHARKYGYLDKDQKWQQPRTDGKPFGDFQDDIAYRKFCQSYGSMKPIDLPNLFRLRHTETTYQPPVE